MIRSVLLTGTRAPATLDLARRLWREGVRVIGADSMHFPLGRFSRAFASHHEVPSPRHDRRGFLQAIEAIARSESVDLIWPTCEEVFHLAVGRESLSEITQVLCPELAVLELLHHKLRFAQWAHELGHAITSPESWNAADAPRGERLVWKPCYSRFAARTRFDEPPTGLDGWMAQRFVPGNEFCSWALCVDGEVRVMTQYRCPVRAGRGAGCAFEPVWSEAAHSFTKLVAGQLRFTGSLAFDFIETAEGKVFVLECNPRLTSGLHLLSPETKLTGLLSGEAAPMPPPQRAAQLLLPVLFSKPHLARSSADVIASHDDRWPAWAQGLTAAEFIWRAATKGVSLLEATTCDIEYNGPYAIIASKPEDEKLRAWFAPVLANGSRWCAPNLETTCAFIRVGGIELPLTINDAQWGNSWVCSPFTHFISYAQEEIRDAVGAVVALLPSLMLRAIGVWLRRVDFNRVVMVNNWLMSTNPWPRWDGQSLPAMLRAFRERWPDHAWVMRSLNERADAPLIAALGKAGARLIPSRQIWWFEPGSEKVRQSRVMKQDERLLHRDDLERVDHEALNEGDIASLSALYHELYLGKYSQHNPSYTAPWLQHLWRERLLHFTALRERGGEFMGVEACGVFNGTLVSPIVGYALARSRKLGLYRRLAALPVLAARHQDLPLNLSAGVGQFKALRGGEPVMEYIAVFDSHLPQRRRLPWRVIELVSQRVLAPLVRRWKL